MSERNHRKLAEREDRQVTREDLPESLFKVATCRIGDHNPYELDALSTKPQRTLPVPDDIEDEGLRRRMANLAQYRGRTPDGQRKAMANLRRRQSMPESQPVQPDPNVPAPRMPTPTQGELKRLPKHPPVSGIWLKRVLDKSEYDVYMEQWNEIWQAHQDEYTDPLDQMDVHTICLEAAVQLRMLKLQMENPKRFSPKAYHDSTVRQQKARENLASRRVDRIGSKANLKSMTQNNIAVLAGQTDEKKVQEIVEQDESNQMAFLESTAKGNAHVRKILRGETPGNNDDQGDVIDGEATPIESDE